MDAGGVGDKRGRRRGARRTWRSSPFSGVAWRRPRPPDGAVFPVLSPGPPGWRRPLRAPPLLFRFHLHFTLPRTRAHTHENFSAARDALSAFPPLFTTPPRPLSLLSLAVLPPLPHLLLPVGGVHISAGNRELSPRPITEGISPRPPIGVEPAFFHQGGGCWPNFPKRSPGGAPRPLIILLPGPFLSVGSGGVVILPPLPISKRSLREGLI
jgi:hypothetical protein